MIYKAQISDAAVVAELAAKVWTSASAEDLIEEFKEFLVSEDAATYLYIINIPYMVLHVNDYSKYIICRLKLSLSSSSTPPSLFSSAL